MISFHFANENKKSDTGWCYLIKQRSVGGIKNQNKRTCVTPQKLKKFLGDH